MVPPCQPEGAHSTQGTKARASADPPFEPPAGFRPDLPSAHARREQWRGAGRFPALRGAVGWLWGMLDRARDETPPVTEGEFADLAAWYEAHAPALAVLARPTGMLPVGGDRRTCDVFVRDGVAAGPSPRPRRRRRIEARRAASGSCTRRARCGGFDNRRRAHG